MIESENNLETGVNPVDNSLPVKDNQPGPSDSVQALIVKKKPIRKYRVASKGQGGGLIEERRDSLKEEVFINAYCSNGMNGTQAMLKVSPDISVSSASCMASRYLAKESVREAILARMLPLDRDISIINQALEAKKEKAISWSDTHKFLETSLKVKGIDKKDSEPARKVNIGLVFN